MRESLTIVRALQAREDVLGHAYYIAENASLNASDRFLTAVETAYKRLADMPGMGSPRDYGPEYPSLRVWPVPKFPRHLIFYQTTETELRIVRVINGAQDIAQIFSPADED